MTNRAIPPMLFCVWKPRGPSSNQILNIIRREAGTWHVGHAGTLDPLAEGILVVGIGREATKRLHEAAGAEKEYEVKIKLGEESTTDDAEGEKHPVVNETWEMQHGNFPIQTDIEGVLEKFNGGYMQTPPMYSAIKIKGERAYRLARSGKEPKLEARFVEIKSIEILAYAWPYLSLRVVTGPGVYIRSLARDIGRMLRVGGYVTELIRTRVGNFTKDACVKITIAKSGETR